MIDDVTLARLGVNCNALKVTVPVSVVTAILWHIDSQASMRRRTTRNFVIFTVRLMVLSLLTNLYDFHIIISKFPFDQHLHVYVGTDHDDRWVPRGRGSQNRRRYNSNFHNRGSGRGRGRGRGSYSWSAKYHGSDQKSLDQEGDVLMGGDADQGASRR